MTVFSPQKQSNHHVIAQSNVIMPLGSKSIDYILGLWGAFNRGCSSAMQTPLSFIPFGKRKACSRLFSCISILFKNILDSMSHPKHGRVLSFLELSHDMSNVGESGYEKVRDNIQKRISVQNLMKPLLVIHVWDIASGSRVMHDFDFSLSFSWNWPTLSSWLVRGKITRQQFFFFLIFWDFSKV